MDARTALVVTALVLFALLCGVMGTAILLLTAKLLCCLECYAGMVATSYVVYDILRQINWTPAEQE